MRLRRFVRLGLVVGAVLVGLVGCGGDETASQDGTTTADGGSASGEPVRLGILLAAAANTYSQAELEGAREAAEELNATVEFFDGEFKSDTQVAQIQDAATSGNFDALVISPNDGGAVVPAMEEAIADGMVIVCMLTPCGTDVSNPAGQVEGQSGFVGISFAGNGQFMGNEAVAACEGIDPCEVAVYVGLFSFPADRLMLDEFEKIVGEYPNIKVVAKQEAGYLADPAFKVTQNILQANPGLDVVVTSGDQMTFGAQQAIDDAGKSGEIALIGAGASKLAVDAVRDGRWRSTYIALPFTEGKEAATLAIKAVRGELEGAESILIEDISPVGAQVDQENVEGFEAEWEG